MQFIRYRATALLAILAFALLMSAGLMSAGASAQNNFSGTYKGNGKPAALTQVAAYKGDADAGKPLTVLLFSAKSQAGSKKPAFDALFGKFGDALIVQVDPDGKVMGVDVIHASLDTPGGSVQVIGVLKMTDYKVADGTISGHISTGGQKSLPHDQSWEVDLTFQTKAP